MSNSTLARARQIRTNCRRAHHSFAVWHSRARFPILHRIACVLAERSCSAPQALGIPARNGRRRPVSALLEPSRRRAQASAPAPAPSSRRKLFI
eukprot:4099030-Pleurochrysis_carterae.AAC.3